MSHEILSLKCPNCGAPAARSQKSCDFCSTEIIITSFSTLFQVPPANLGKYTAAYKGMLESNPQDGEISTSLGMCYLKLKLYDKAEAAFASAIEHNVGNPEAHFYAAVSLLKGSKAFLASRATVNQIEAYLNAACSIEPRALFYYFQSYIKYDYYSRKSFTTSPTYGEAYQNALDAGVTDFEIEQLYALLGVARPECL